jgi:hypothetical protein
MRERRSRITQALHPGYSFNWSVSEMRGRRSRISQVLHPGYGYYGYGRTAGASILRPCARHIR